MTTRSSAASARSTQRTPRAKNPAPRAVYATVPGTIPGLSAGSPHIGRLGHWFKRAKYLQLLIVWILVIIIFAAIYAGISYAQGSLVISRAAGAADVGVIGTSIVFSAANAVLLGYGNATAAGIARVFVVLELFFALILYGMLLSRLFLATLHLWPAMFDNAKNKKVNTIALMFSIFRHDIDAIVHKIKTSSNAGGQLPKNIARDLEAASEEFYLALLEVELLFAPPGGKNLAGHHITLLLHNVEASLEKMKELLHAMAEKDIRYASKTFLFNLKYTTELTEKIGKKYDQLGTDYGDRAKGYFTSIRELREEIRAVI